MLGILNHCSDNAVRLELRAVGDYLDSLELFGHSDVSTTMIYTHVLNRPGIAVRSPLDAQGPF